MKMKNKWGRYFYLTMMVLFVLGHRFINVSVADENVISNSLSITGYRTTSDGIIVFIKNGSLINEIPVVQIGTDLCENVEIQTDFPRRTLILLDNSKSISSRWKKETIELISSVIKGHTEKEKFKIATYANGLTVWADYSDDYDNLISIAQNIPFKKQKSFLTDIFYDLLVSESKEEIDAYTRIIIISDGADHNEITYTQDELKDLIKKSGVSINAVGVSTDNNADALNLLFSYARLTNGNTIVVKQGDNSQAATEMLVREDITAIKIIPDLSMRDGSSIEAKITFNLQSGEVSLRTILEMPFADIRSSVEADEKAEQDKESDEYAPFDESINDQTDESIEDNSIFLYVAIIGGAILLISAIIMMLVIIRKKKQEEENNEWEYLPEETTDVSYHPNNKDANVGGRTMPLWPENDGYIGKETKTFILLTSTSTNKVFKTIIDEKIIIGRNAGLDISLTFDGTVSGKHCEIYKNGGELYIKDLKSSNGTLYNKTRIFDEGKKIQNGGVISIGQDSYKLTIEYI